MIGLRYEERGLRAAPDERGPRSCDQSGLQQDHFASPLISQNRRGKKFSRRSFLYGALATTFAAATTACTPHGNTRIDENHLNLQAAWINDAEFIGYFIALDNGYY
jgi:hypothetical protein